MFDRENTIKKLRTFLQITSREFPYNESSNKLISQKMLLANARIYAEKLFVLLEKIDSTKAINILKDIDFNEITRVNREISYLKENVTRDTRDNYENTKILVQQKMEELETKSTAYIVIEISKIQNIDRLILAPEQTHQQTAERSGSIRPNRDH